MKTKAELEADLSKYTEVLFAMSAALENDLDNLFNDPNDMNDASLRHITLDKLHALPTRRTVNSLKFNCLGFPTKRDQQS